MNARSTLRTSAMRFLAACIILATPAFAGATPPTCVGDCDGSGEVTVDEIVKMVRVALGDAPVAECPAGDADSDGSITVDEVITAVNTALGGCGAPATTPTADTSHTPTPEDTETPTLTPTAAAVESQTAEPTETEAVEPTETETPEPTTTNGMMPLTTTPGVSLTETPAQTASPGVTPTDTPEPQATATTQAEPTLSPVILPTHTPEPLPTSSPVGSGSASVDLGNASGPAGSTVTVAVTLNDGNNRIAATSNDIFFDTSRVNVVQDGGVACTINPAIGQGTAYTKMLLLSVAPQSDATARLRVGMISFTNSLAVPDGLLFTCQFQIAADAAPGMIVLDNVPEASDGIGNAVSVGGSTGVITVQ